jgi:CubicO group peptidase (beta-lactamase class C family)
VDEAFSPATSRALLHRVATAQVEARVPSLVAAVARDSRLIWSAGRGCVGDTAPTTNTQYRIGSISKTFAAVLVMRLRDEGLLDLADPVERHVPGTSAGEATIGQLLAHTSGLATETPPPWWERTPGDMRPEITSLLWEESFRHPAARRWHYSNVGYALLGAVVERVRGRPWFDALRDEVLEPLGMRRTTLLPVSPHADGWAVHPWADVVMPEVVHDTGLMSPAGQLWSTAEDLVKFGSLLLDGNDDVLRADTVAEMCEPASGPAELEVPMFYGLGVMIARQHDRTLLGHFGSMPGFVASLLVEPAEGLTAVTFANATLPPAFVPVSSDLIRIVADNEPVVPAEWAPHAHVDAQALALTGIWYRGPVPFSLRLLGNGTIELVNLATPGPSVGLRPVGDNTWVVHTPGYYKGEQLQVVSGVDGETSHLDLGSVVFTRQPYPPGEVTPGGVDRDWGA